MTQKPAAAPPAAAPPAPAPTLEIQTVAIGEVRPYPRNPRRNDGEAVAKVAESLREFGWRQPLVVDEGMELIVGHTRLKAALSLGMKAVPVHIARGLTPDQVKAYRLADNRTGDEAEWDKDLLQLELGDLADKGFDLALTGFDEAELTGAEPGAPAELIEVAAVGRFWLSVQGPFAAQPAAIAAIRALAAFDGVEVASNIIDA